MQQPKLTFIHGFMGHPSDWDDVRAALPKYETFAAEIGVSPDWQASVQQLADTMPEPSIMVGYSMGARLSLGVAMEFPQKCQALILISGNPGLESAEAREQRSLSDEQIAKQIETDELEPFLNQWYRASVFATVPEEIRRAEVQRKLAQSSSNWPAILRANSVAGQPNFWPRLNELSMPVLVIAGEQDEKYREIAFRFAAEQPLPNATTKIIPNCGHIVHREQPEALVEIVRTFVEGLGIESESQPES